MRLRTIENTIWQKKFFFKRNGHRIDKNISPAKGNQQHISAETGFPERIYFRPVVVNDFNSCFLQEIENAQNLRAASGVQRENGLPKQVLNCNDFFPDNGWLFATAKPKGTLQIS